MGTPNPLEAAFRTEADIDRVADGFGIYLQSPYLSGLVQRGLLRLFRQASDFLAIYAKRGPAFNKCFENLRVAMLTSWFPRGTGFRVDLHSRLPFVFLPRFLEVGLCVSCGVFIHRKCTFLCG
jgi:hypothetical protein